MDEGGRRNEPVRPRGKLVRVVLLLLFASVIAAALFIYQDHWMRPKKSAQTRNALTNDSEPPAITNAAVLTNPPGATNTPKSLADLKAGPIALEKTKGNSLVYAVGILRNDSDHQRFGVTIELALSDARGNPAGRARDYRAVLEPRQQWRFRALTLDSKAASAQVSEIREEE